MDVSSMKASVRAGGRRCISGGMRHAPERLLTALGLAGGLAFVVGSVLFLNPERYTEGVYLFIFGSAAMLLERLGRIWLER